MASGVRVTGPLFDGRALVAIELGLKAAERAVAEDAKQELYAAFGETFQNPTGYYESQVQVRSSTDGFVVNDGGVVYGPWLEGVGSRNYPVTRFKGYANFRRVTEKVKHGASVVADVAMRGFVRRMNI